MAVDRETLILELKMTASHLQKDGRVGASGAIQKAVAEFERCTWTEPHIYLDLTQKSPSEVSAILRNAADEIDSGVTKAVRYGIWV